MALGPALALLTADLVTLHAPLTEPACWILPNALVLPLPTNVDCSLRSDELVTAVIRNGRRVSFAASDSAAWNAASVDAVAAVEVMSNGERKTRSLSIRHVDMAERFERLLFALLLTCLSLAIPLSILWTSTAPAAIPIALAYGLVAAIGIGVITGRNSPGVTSAAVMAACAAPSVLVHLALVFPRERPIVCAAPTLLPLSYLPFILFAPLGQIALHSDPAVWPAFLSLLLVLTGAAWLCVVTACAFAVRESRSQLERARARTLGFGALLLPILPTVLLAKNSSSAAVWSASYVACATVALPVPIGLAITSYNLFDVGWDARRWIGRVVYLCSAAALIAVIMRFGIDLGEAPISAARAFALALCALAAMEAPRSRLLTLVESMLLPHVQRLRREREAFSQRVVALRDEDEVAQLLARAVSAALNPAGGCVALRIDSAWRVASTFGPTPGPAVAAAGEAERFVTTQGIAHLAQEDFETRPDARKLLMQGIEVVAAVRAGRRTPGLLLVSARETLEPYTGFEIEFVRTLCSHTAAALENSRMASELLTVERRATSGRIAVALAHDLGKELAWIARLAGRLPERAQDTRRLERDADQIAELAEAALQELQQFVRDSSGESGNQRLARIDEIFELAVRQVSRRYGDARIAVRLDPTLRGVRAHAALTQVLANALENGILAADVDPTVELSVQSSPRGLHLEVRDSGRGMSAETVARACEAGFTSRQDQGGLGVGLTAARDIVSALGGSLGICSAPGQGTTVSIDLPAAEANT
ncbi:MAG: sensor histidine kinase [Deltaproteobacteria bacterium]|nr:sensor histidine kinase [Deltaproteobacteria bacterium]